MMKAIRAKRLTTREVARLLGVSEASVKRWADSGLLSLEKTAGGHRRFRPEDVAAVRRAGLREETPSPPGKGAPGAAAAQPGAEAGLAPGAEAELVGETFRALMDGRDEDLSALLVNLHLHGHTVAAVADNFLCAAMRQVGELWREGEVSVAQEHMATRTAVCALRKLRAVIDAPAGGGPLALCCSVEDDFHELPVRIAALTLEAAGFDVLNLGVSTPFYALAEAAGRFRPDLVCVSSAILNGLDRAAREYAEFQRATRRGRATVVLGGAGFAPEAIRGRLPADLHAASFSQLEGFVGTLGDGGS